MKILEQFNLGGKKALVTGCNKGIGKSLALALAEAGADIIGVSGTLEAGKSEIEQEVKSIGKDFYPYRCDFSDRKQLYAFIQQVKSEHVVDILVNNAGTVLRKPIAEHPDEYWDKVLAVNLDAPFILAREFGKDMLERKKGKIIFTCSVLSFQGGITVPGYAASKGALASLIKAFANEWAVHRVNVNGIAPGYIVTANTEPLRNDPIRNKTIMDRTPAGRWGDPDDIKGVVVYLASDASDFVHGTIFNVDGGWMGR